MDVSVYLLLHWTARQRLKSPTVVLLRGCRLNEARIALLDAKSYARQLLLPIQPLYRHPELLVVAKPVQQSTPSPTLVQPEQLTAEQQQHDTQQQSDQRKGQESQQCEPDEAGPRLEKLQQQRQQLLRSIGSLQRQQHELQRELEEHRVAGEHQSGSSSTSNSLRWHELQKLQQQQQNKQKRLIECETEIGQWLHRREKEHQEVQQHQLSQKPQQQTQAQPQNQQQQGEPNLTETQKVERSASENQGSTSIPSRHCDWQQSQQPVLGNCEEDAPNVTPACKTAPHKSMDCLSPSVAAAADLVNEAAAAALSGREQAKPEGDSPSWDSATSSESDTDAAKGYTVFEEYGHTGGNSSSGFPTATTAVPTPPPLRREASSSTQQRRSSSEIPPSRTSSRERTKTPNAGRAREYSCVSASRLAGRYGSRASSAGPQIRTGEAARTATAATPAATARRSLTTCINSLYSTVPPRAAGAAAVRKANQPKRSTAYWEETDSSSKSSTSDSSSCSRSSSDSNGDGGRETIDRGPEKQWTEANLFGRNKFAAGATGGAASNIAPAAAPAANGSSGKAAVQPRQQQPPSPPPRRVAATQGVRKDGSRSSSAGSGGCKTRVASGRRRFVRTRGYLQQHHGASQQQRNEEQKRQEQPQRRQQLWRGTLSGSETTGSIPTEQAGATAAGGPSSEATPQTATAAAAAWLLPPDFPEPFGAQGRQLQPRSDNFDSASVHPQQQQEQRRKLHCDYPDTDSLLHAAGQEQKEDTQSPTHVDSPALFSQSLDGHRMRQQRLQQGLQQQHVLHRELQKHREMQAAAEADKRQLLFPDEDLPTFPANAEATDTGKSAVSGLAAANTARSVPAPPGEESPASPDGRWVKSEKVPDHYPDNVQPQRSQRWPVPHHSRSAVPQEDSHPTRSSLHLRRDEESATLAEGTPTDTSGDGQGIGAPEMQQASSASGAASAGESCGSSASNYSAEQTDRRESTSGRNSSSDSEPEDPADRLGASGQWRPAIYSRQKRQLHQKEQEHLYRSATQGAFTQPAPPVADGAGSSHWAPQRSSVPPSSSCVNESATLRRGTGAATATPTRLFPHYDPADVEVQRPAQGVSFAGTHEVPCSVPSGATAAALSEGHSASPSDPLRRLSPRGDAFSALGGSGAPFLGDSRQLGEVPPAVSMWQHLRTRASLPQTRENTLLHSPSRSQRM